MIDMTTLKKYFLFVILGCFGWAYAQPGQTINQGILYVAPGTLMTNMSDFNNTQTGEYKNDGEVLLRGNFNNDGITTFNQQHQGYTRFEGFDSQDITGSIPADFYDVLFSNQNPQPAFRLSGDMGVSGNADFMYGIVNNDDYGGIIVFEEGATHTNVDHGSHVDGYVQKNGAEDFRYPIGDSHYYRFAAISPPGNSHQVFTGKYFYENSDLFYSHDSRTGIIELINNKEYWTITKDADGEDVLVTLSWDESTTTPQEIVAAPYEAIHIVRWDQAQKLWVSEGGVADIDSRTVTSTVQVDGYGVFTLARVKTDLILPDDIVIYNAVTPDDDGMNDYFIIDNIQRYPNNRVKIYNRWGVKLFETTNYDSSGNVFKGFSEARATINSTSMLPTGTYFYEVEYYYTGENPRWIKKVGYLQLNTD